MKREIALALAVRVSIALFTQTFFQPDEYFQSLEVAHHLVFGYGQLTWEWRAENPIRSVLYPLLNVPAMWSMKVAGLDHTLLLILLPKLVHGLLAAMTDIWLCQLTRKLLGERYVGTALFLSLTSFFHGLALSRSLSNSLETSLTTIALSFYPWQPAAFKRSDVRKCLVFAALACAIRPTNAVIWVYLFTRHVWALRDRPNAISALAVDVLAIGNLAACLVFVPDWAYYGKRTLTPRNFVAANLSVSSFYGTSPWHYYLTQGLPILCTTALPFVLHGLQRFGDDAVPTSGMQTMRGLVFFTLASYSLAGHKEWRFLHPLLPILHVCAAKSLVDINPPSAPPATGLAKPDSPVTLANSLCLWPRVKKAHLILLLLNIPAIGYVVFLHGRAQITVMHYLRSLPADAADGIGFLMPCHSTPWQAYLHRADLAQPGRLWALGCEPPLGSLGDFASYNDQTAVFYASPVLYLRERFPSTINLSFPPSPHPTTAPGSTTALHRVDDWLHEWPRFLVFFGALLDNEGVRAMLIRRGYAEVWSGINGWEEDERRRGRVRVWRVSGGAVPLTRAQISGITQLVN